ncbi:hypothetical protein D9M69_639340 [compost metagenome]
MVLHQNGQRLVANLGRTNRSRSRLAQLVGMELMPARRALRLTQPVHQVDGALQLRINRACIGVAQPFGQGVTRQLAGSPHTVAIDFLDTLETAQHRY